MSQFQTPFHSLPDSIKAVLKLLTEKTCPKQVLLFGSRARKDNRENSDFDFVVKDRQCDDATWSRTLVDIEANPITLFKLDIVEYEKLNSEYQKNISNEGVLIYG